MSPECFVPFSSAGFLNNFLLNFRKSQSTVIGALHVSHRIEIMIGNRPGTEERRKIKMKNSREENSEIVELFTCGYSVCLVQLVKRRWGVSIWKKMIEAAHFYFQNTGR